MEALIVLPVSGIITLLAVNLLFCCGLPYMWCWSQRRVCFDLHFAFDLHIASLLPCERHPQLLLLLLAELKVLHIEKLTLSICWLPRAVTFPPAKRGVNRFRGSCCLHLKGTEHYR